MTPLFDIDGEPTDPLIRLLDLCEVQHDCTLASIRDATQAAWYQAGKLRSEILEGKHGSQRDLIIPLLRELGIIDALRAPIGSRWGYALVLGAMLTAVRKRIAHLARLWELGTRFRQVVLLGSQRALNQDKEGLQELIRSENPDLPFDLPEQMLTMMPTNEGEMMDFVYRLAASRLPWGDLPVKLVVAPKVEGRNINTADTIKHWLVGDAQPGSCLVVSSQPFCQYQGLVVQSCLPPGFAPENGVVAVGYQAPDSITVAAHLDGIAKTIFEIAKARGV